jgi:hypothetical protein
MHPEANKILNLLQAVKVGITASETIEGYGIMVASYNEVSVLFIENHKSNSGRWDNMRKILTEWSEGKRYINKGTSYGPLLMKNYEFPNPPSKS